MINIRFKAVIFISISICNGYSYAQDGYTTNTSELEEFYERNSIIHPTSNGFTDMRPYLRGQISDIVLEQREKDSTTRHNVWSPYLNLEFYEIDYFGKQIKGKRSKNQGIPYPNEAAMAAVNNEYFSLRVNPVLELKIGREQENENTIYHSTRGVEMMGSIGGSVNFYTQLTENQMRPFQYISQYGSGFQGQNNYLFNPYYTYWKDLHNGQGYDFTNAIGYVEYRPSKRFSLMLGHDRNHYGYGYRSLFVGDNGAPYFQIKANAYIWKFHYHLMLAEFTGQYVRGADRLLPKKYGAFHVLSFKPSPKLEMGLYEGIIFHRSQGFELNYLNPLIFYHSIEHALGSADNVFMGFQAKYNVNNFTQFYTQFLLDDMQVGQFLQGSGWWGNKYGIQLGGRFVNIFQIHNLDGQLEYNMVRPYTYSHYGSNDTLDNLTHYNQPLAHPFGANFMEIYGRLSYRPLPRLKLEMKLNYNKRGYDQGGQLFGNNIFANTTGTTIPNEYNVELLQGNKLNQIIFTTGGQYQIFHNIFWDLDIIYRKTKVETSQATNSTIGLITGLRVNLRKRDYLF